MKSLICFILITAASTIVNSQSSIVFDAGTNIDVGAGADICAESVTINGTYTGTGTLCEGPLPVELTSFTAAVENNNVLLKWRTETEVDNYGFDVERKLEVKGQLSGVWKKISFVEGHGNSNSPKQYSYTDIKPFGGSKLQYRLKQIDTDGQFEYSDIVEVEIVPDKFELFQNYPNPFNPATTIKYSVPVNSFVTIKIYDVLGKEVETLVNEEKQAGNYEFPFTNYKLSSGVYFYRMQAGSFVNTKKFIFMK